MSKYLLMFLVLAQPPVLQRAGAKWEAVETITFQWVKDGHSYTLSLEELASADGGNVRLRIKVPDGRDFTVSVPRIAKLSEAPVDQKLIQDNLLQSTYLYLTPKLKGHAGRPMLVVFGGALASDPGSLLVLSLDRTGYPVELFSSKTFELEAMRDLDADGTPELIGVHCLSQLWGTCFSTYDPFSVYRFSRSTSGKATLSLPLSRKYNRKHYYGWAGPKCSEDIAVVRCAPKGKPRIMSAREAERLYRK